MSADRTPAPVAVPEGGWQDGDWFVLTLRDGPVTYRREPNGWRRQPSNVRYDEVSFEQWLSDGIVAYVHAPRPEPVVAPSEAERVQGNIEAAHTEYEALRQASPNDPALPPVVAPLPTEAVGEVLTRHPRPWRVETAHVDTESGDGGDPFIQDANGSVVGAAMLDDGSDYDVIDLVVEAVNRLVPEDDEDTVRRVRALAESWAEADGETVDDHGLTTLTVTNRLGRTLLAALDGPQ